VSARTAAPLAADLEQGLKRLKLRRMRQLAPELLQTAKTQRWLPEELLRTLVEAEIAARDEANLRSRLRAAGFPQPKRLDDFQLAASSIPRPTFDYLAGLEWVRSADNACLIGPPGTGKSHVLIGCGLAAVEAGMRVRYLRADELVELLYLGIASHWPFQEWGRFLPEHSTAVALLDRLLHHATVVVTAGESFRMKEAKTRGGGRPSAP